MLLQSAEAAQAPTFVIFDFGTLLSCAGLDLRPSNICHGMKRKLHFSNRGVTYTVQSIEGFDTVILGPNCQHLSFRSSLFVGANFGEASQPPKPLTKCLLNQSMNIYYQPIIREQSI